MSNIPQAREELHQLAADLRKIGHADLSVRLMDIADEHLFRKQVTPKTRPKSTKMDSVQASLIRDYKKRNPSVSLQTIGNVFHVNAGRVSEALAGKW